MKKSELKKILKPLVQECIKESLLEDVAPKTTLKDIIKFLDSHKDAKLNAGEPAQNLANM